MKLGLQSSGGPTLARTAHGFARSLVTSTTLPTRKVWLTGLVWPTVIVELFSLAANNGTTESGFPSKRLQLNHCF